MGNIAEKLQTLDGLIDQLIANQGSIGDSNDDGFYDIPNDGNTYLFVDIPRDDYTAKLYLATGGNYKISWGDNTEDDSGRGYDYDSYATPYIHWYEKRGKYVIKVEAEKLKIITDFNHCDDESYSNYELSNTSSIFYDPINYYVYDDSTGCLIQYTNILEKIVIGSTVREINDYALANCKNLKSVIIYPYTYLNFGENVFRNCTALKECIIRSDNTSGSFTLIPKNTFYNCNSLRYFNFPANVTEIENGAFYNCMSLEEVTFNSAQPPQCHYSDWETVEVYDEYLGEYTQKDVYIPSSFDGFKTLYPVAVYILNAQNKSKYINCVNTYLGYTWGNIITFG